MVIQRVPTFDRSRFPDSDGDPMPEVESHYQQLAGLKFTARTLLADVDRVHVGGNHFVYYDVTDPRKNVAPDVYVAFGVERHEREYYLAFEEGVFPQLIVEVISKSSRKDDLGAKVQIYEQQGVQEYYVCDPRPGIRARRRLHVWRSANGILVPQMIGPEQRVHSDLLRTDLQLIGRFLRLLDPRTGLPIPTPDEDAAARIAAERRAGEEEAARLAAEQRMLQMEHELAALRAQVDPRSSEGSG